jgi:hypothetical protein
MKARTALVCLGCVFAAFLGGCGDSTDVSKATNDAYHDKTGAAKPPADAMQPKGGQAFVGQPSGGVGGTAAAPNNIPGAGSAAAKPK